MNAMIMYAIEFAKGGYWHKSEQRSNCGKGYYVAKLSGGCLYTLERNAKSRLPVARSSGKCKVVEINIGA